MPADDLTARALEHIRQLAVEIGPRGATTPAEKQAAIHCARTFEEVGLSPSIETFPAATSRYHPHVIAGGGLFVAFTLYPVMPIFSAVLALASFVSIVSEMGGMKNPVRRIVPRAESQNVIAVLDPAAEVQRDVVLLAHLDTGRTPWLFRTAGLVRAHRVLGRVIFAVFDLMVLAFMAGAVFRLAWMWGVLALGVPFLIVYMVMTVQADLTPFSHGAINNASGVGVLLALAEALKADPLANTRVWFVCAGAGEVGYYGTAAFFRQHRDELISPVALGVEALGAAGPVWVTAEGIGGRVHADPSLLGQVADLAVAHPGWGAYPVRLAGVNTAMGEALRAGVPAITVMGAGRDGLIPHQYQRSDTVEQIDPDLLRGSGDMVLTIIRRLEGVSGGR